MSDSNSTRLNRRRFLVTGATVLGGLAAAPALAQSTFVDSTANDPLASRNISSFHSQTWQPYFSSLKGGAILVDTTSRALHFWSADGTIYKLYPTSVPLSEDMTRRGRTTVVNKVEGPSWSPTPAMKKRNPEWPDFVPPGPDNPLGTHALYLGWKYYRIHGTHDTRKIGRRSSSGCIGLYNEHIAELYSLVQPGCQVLLI